MRHSAAAIQIKAIEPVYLPAWGTLSPETCERLLVLAIWPVEIEEGAAGGRSRSCGRSSPRSDGDKPGQEVTPISNTLSVGSIAAGPMIGSGPPQNVRAFPRGK